MTKKRTKKHPSIYYSPDVLPYSICVACLGVVIENNEKARELYDDVIDCFDLPGLQEMTELAKDVIPDKDTFMKELVETSGYDYSKPPNIKTLGIEYSRGLFQGGKKVFSSYAEAILPKLWKKRRHINDVVIMLQKVNDLMIEGFNREGEKEKGKYKIPSNNSDTLRSTIILCANTAYSRLLLKRWEKDKIIHYGGQSYSMEDVMTDKVTHSLHRNLTKQYNNNGFILMHDHTFDKMVNLWYQCRIVYSGPTAYYQYLQKNKLEVIDPVNLLHEIEKCDEAVGYIRGKGVTNEFDFERMIDEELNEKSRFTAGLMKFSRLFKR